MKILITGSSGMIGTRLFEKLLEQGHDVYGLDKRKNEYNSKLNERTIIHDLTKTITNFFEFLDDKYIISKWLNSMDIIFHLAANARVWDLIQNPDLALKNYQMTHNILEYARKKGIKKFVFSSSREVYGNINYGRKIGEQWASVDNCESPYSASKIGGEGLVRAYGKCYGIEYDIYRFSNVYGMYDFSDRFIPLCIYLAKNNKPITIFNKRKVLDFTYIDDVIDGLILSIPYPNNDVFNLASSNGRRLTKVAELIIKKLDSHSQITINEDRIGEVVKFTADIEKIHDHRCFKPKYTNINKMIDKTIEWYLKPENYRRLCKTYEKN